MFTEQQTHTQRNRSRFTDYTQELKILGVTFYETFVIDSHTDYFGTKIWGLTGKYVMLKLNFKNSLSSLSPPTGQNRLPDLLQRLSKGRCREMGC
ncbi:MAG: DUF1398 family protein [Bacteroidetes bacterium]|nr:DUF1398 family protein [Bacteroidota bacterium]